jgi:LmbE family N-acetylglucosaminyl deacetylase
LNILAVEAHPDDVEFLCAGTLARLAALGHAISILSVTGGEYGSATLNQEQVRELRAEESREAAAVIGAQFHLANGRDKHFIFNEAVRNRMVEIFRIARPDIVFALSPKDYVLDHDFASLLARDAATAASVVTLQTGETNPAPPLRGIPYLYYCEPMWQMDVFGDPVPSGTYVDISETLEAKKRMLACHVSQVEFMRGRFGEPDVAEIVETFGRNAGRAAGFAYAEGFRQHKAPPFPSDDVLAKLVGGRAGRREEKRG